MGKAFEKLAVANASGKHLCVGLDPDFDHARKVIKGPRGYGMSDALVSDDDYAPHYVSEIIKQTGKYAAAFKFNFEFWCNPDYNFQLLMVLRSMIQKIRFEYPDVAIILDRKYGDIGNTSGRSASFAVKLGVDAVTVNPYMGTRDVTDEFAKVGVDCFLLARTSNLGGEEFQRRQVGKDVSLAEAVALSVRFGVRNDNPRGIVVGATNATELANLQSLVPDVPFLIPGVGAQGGDLNAVVLAMQKHEAPWIVNVGRGIAEASDDPLVWPSLVAESAKKYHEAMKQT